MEANILSLFFLVIMPTRIEDEVKLEVEIDIEAKIE